MDDRYVIMQGGRSSQKVFVFNKDGDPIGPIDRKMAMFYWMIQAVSEGKSYVIAMSNHNIIFTPKKFPKNYRKFLKRLQNARTISHKKKIKGCQ